MRSQVTHIINYTLSSSGVLHQSKKGVVLFRWGNISYELSKEQSLRLNSPKG